MVFQHVASVMISLSSQRAANAPSSVSNSPMTTRLTGSPERVALAFVVAAGISHSRWASVGTSQSMSEPGGNSVSEIAAQIVDGDARDGNGKRELVVRIASRPPASMRPVALSMQVARRVERDVDDLGARVERREHEPSDSPPGGIGRR